MLAVFHLFQPFGYYGFGTLAGLVLVARGFDVTSSLLFTALSFIGYPLGSLISIPLLGRIERKFAVMVSVAAMAGCGIAFATVSSPALIVAFGVLTTAAANVFSNVYHVYQAEIFPSDVRATAVGWTYSLSRLSSAALPFVLIPVLDGTAPPRCSPWSSPHWWSRSRCWCRSVPGPPAAALTKSTRFNRPARQPRRSCEPSRDRRGPPRLGEFYPDLQVRSRIMARKGRIDPRLATQVLVLQFAVVAFTLVIAFGLFAVFSHQRIAYEYGVRALDIARVLATAPVVRSGVAGFDEANQPGPLSPEELAKGPLEAIAMDIQRQHRRALRRDHQRPRTPAHPSGRRRARQADEHRARPTRSPGTRKWSTKPGRSAPRCAAKVPIVDPNSQRVIGEVSVGISTAAVHQQLWSNIRTSAVLGGVALLLGGAGSILLARRWRVLTLGLRPAEMAEWCVGRQRCCTASAKASSPPTRTGRPPSSTRRPAACSASATTSGGPWPTSG